MNRRTAILLTGLFGLAACATPTPPVSVTRFHLDQAIERGTIMIEQAPGNSGPSLEFGGYAAAVAAELQRIGYVTTDDRSRGLYLAVVDVQQGLRQAPPAGSPVSVGIGGGSGGWGGGIGGGISFGLGGNRNRDVLLTQLSVVLKRRSDQQVMWEGRARSEVQLGKPAAQPGLIAGRLAQALFRDFPGESGRTINVP